LPFFIGARKTPLTSSIELLKSQQITATAQELHDALHSHIFHPLFDERSFSALQLPTFFQRWLEPLCSSPAKALKVGKLLHALLAESYQQIWHMRCDEIKAKGLLFKDRLQMLPQDKPLAEMSSSLAITSLHLPMRGGDDKPRCPHGNINHDHGVVGALLSFLRLRRSRERITHDGIILMLPQFRRCKA
jgi:hypothetical protein